jgi:Protein of unknown function (DUF2794)
MGSVIRLSDVRRRVRPTFFSRPELNQLLSLYSRQVARGQWRDYAIGLQDGKALFAVYRNSEEGALYTIVKSGPGADRKGEFTLLTGRLPLAKGPSLGDILARLQKKLRSNTVLLDSESGR